VNNKEEMFRKVLLSGGFLKTAGAWLVMQREEKKYS